MTKVLMPPGDYGTVGEPLIFLAGPIQGARNWQADAIKILEGLVPFTKIANPRREYVDGTFRYEAQVDWETHHLWLAGQNGVILFWLEREETHDPKRAYAQTTRVEFGEWMVKHQKDGARLVVGIDEGFSGAKYFRHRLGNECPKVKICSSLEEACRAAAAELQRA